MKKIFILLALLLVLPVQNTLSSAPSLEAPSRSLWHSVINTCRSFAPVLSRNLSRLKTIQWTQSNIAKASAITAVASAAVYGLFRLTKYIFGKPQQAPHNTPRRRSRRRGIRPPTKTHNNTIATPPTVTTPVTQPEPISAPPAQPAPLPAFAPATEENLATVPYFANPANHVLAPIEFENPDNHAHITVQQLHVRSQFEIGGGGGASCGYQAGPKNTTAITGLIQGLDTAAMLTNGQIALDLFGTDTAHTGQLRKLTINHRIKTALKQFYIPRIQAIVPTAISSRENPAVLQSIYRNLLGTFLDNILSEALDAGSTNEITQSTLIEALKTMPITVSQVTLQQLGCTEDELIMFLREPETIQRYVQLASPFSVSQDDIEPAWKLYNTRQVAGAFARNGEMINSNEIEYLLEHQRNNRDDTVAARALDPHAVSLTVLEETSPEALKLIAETVTGLQQQIRAGQLPTQKIHAFVLGSSDQAKRSAGHWITMVLELTRNGRRYTITDSADNHIRMFDGACHNLIRFLEGDRAAKLVRASDAFKQQIWAQLNENIARCRQNKNDILLQQNLFSSVLRFQQFVNDYSSFGGQAAFAHAVEPLLPTYM